MEKIIKKTTDDGIFTIESLKESDYYDEYCKACFSVAKRAAGKVYSNRKKDFHALAWSYEDAVSELTFILISKYDKIAKAYLKERRDENGNIKKNNLSAYAKRILDHHMNSLIKEREILVRENYIDPITNKECHRSVPMTETDENGNTRKCHYSSISLSKPISDDGSITLEDTIASNEYNPENRMIFLCTLSELFAERQQKKDTELADSCRDCMYIAGKHSFLAQNFVFIEDQLKKYGVGNNLKKAIKLSSRITCKEASEQENVKKEFVKLYNYELTRYIECLGRTGVDSSILDGLKKYYASEYKQFGRNFVFDDNKEHHLRNYNKNDLKAIKAL